MDIEGISPEDVELIALYLRDGSVMFLNVDGELEPQGIRDRLLSAAREIAAGALEEVDPEL